MYSTWVIFLDICQGTCAVCGFIANVMTFTGLVWSRAGLGRAVSVLLCHQSFVDAIICIMAAVIVMAPPMWRVGNKTVDLIMCHLWHSQSFYWQIYLVSVWNLVMIALERYLCVCKPLLHEKWLKKKRLCIAIAITHTLSLVIVGMSYTQTRFTGVKCISEFAIIAPWVKDFFYVFGFVVFALWYMVPVIILLVLYTIVIRTLKKRIKDGSLPNSPLLLRASTQLTKTLFVVTVIFVLSTSYDLWYYLLGRTGVLVYKKNSPAQKIGVFLSIINTSCNPFVYVLLMPAYRRKIKDTFTSCFKRRKNKRNHRRAIAMLRCHAFTQGRWIPDGDRFRWRPQVLKSSS